MTRDEIKAHVDELLEESSKWVSKNSDTLTLKEPVPKQPKDKKTKEDKKLKSQAEVEALEKEICNLTKKRENLENVMFNLNELEKDMVQTL